VCLHLERIIQIHDSGMETKITKLCKKCGDNKESSEFPVNSNECLCCKRKRNREYMRNRRIEFPELLQAQHKSYRNRNCAYQKRLYKELKEDVFFQYGGKCVCCGEDNTAFLTIDHIHNDGNKHRHKNNRYSGVAIYRLLKKNNYPKDNYQILCYNCNCSKQHDKDGHRNAHPNAINIDGGE